MLVVVNLDACKQGRNLVGQEDNLQCTYTTWEMLIRIMRGSASSRAGIKDTKGLIGTWIIGVNALEVDVFVISIAHNHRSLNKNFQITLDARNPS